MPEHTDFLVVGRIGKPFGVKGWLKIYSYTEPADQLFAYQPWWINGRAHEIVADKEQDTGWIALLKNVHDRDAAALYTNADISIARTQLAPLPPGQFYWAELIGLKVINRQGYLLGNVDHFLNAGASDIVVVKGGAEYWVPLIKGQFSIDRVQATLTVDWHQDDTATGRKS